MIACACVCSSLAWLQRRGSRHGNAVWDRGHTKSFLATFSKSGGPHARAPARLAPLRPQHIPPHAFNTAVHTGHGEGRHAVGTALAYCYRRAPHARVNIPPSGQAAPGSRTPAAPRGGGCPCSSAQVLDAHPPCFTRTRCTILQYTPAQRFPWHPWTFSNDTDVVFL